MKVFICSPYRGDIGHNVAVARRLCKLAVKQGHQPFAPHLYFPRFLNDGNQQERELGTQWGLETLKHCDIMWVYGNPTEGMNAEIRYAKQHSIPIFTHTLDDLMLKGEQK